MTWEIVMAVLVIALIATLVAVIAQTNIDKATERIEPASQSDQAVPDHAVFEPVEEPGAPVANLAPAAVAVGVATIAEQTVDRQPIDDPDAMPVVATAVASDAIVDASDNPQSHADDAEAPQEITPIPAHDDAPVYGNRYDAETGEPLFDAEESVTVPVIVAAAENATDQAEPFGDEIAADADVVVTGVLTAPEDDQLEDDWSVSEEAIVSEQATSLSEDQVDASAMGTSADEVADVVPDAAEAGEPDQEPESVIDPPTDDAAPMDFPGEPIESESPASEPTYEVAESTEPGYEAAATDDGGSSYDSGDASSADSGGGDSSGE